ncbi:Hypothetical protein D9617_12g036540 [Elsinoe fawcettii]|nr:Hypothetical protein D9617_12g036540 [Elsinoe fawcettii]
MKEQNQQSFRLFDLPVEIQILILRQSVLVPPGPLAVTHRGPRYSRECLGAATFHTDWKARPQQASHDPTSPPTCSCSTAHAAFSTAYHDSCLWSPLPLLLVNYEFYQLARLVMYRHNTFILQSISDFDLPGIYQAPSLSQIPAISQMTSLIFQLPGCTSLLYNKGPVLRWWFETIKILSSKANLPCLTLEVHFWGWGYDASEYEELGGPGRDKGLDEYTALSRAATELKGLKKFFVYFKLFEKANFDLRWLELERRLEKMVMGPEYDAQSHGKQARFRSVAE